MIMRWHRSARSAMAAAIGANGGSTLLYLARLVALFYAGCLFLVLVVFGITLYRRPVFKGSIKDEIVLVLDRVREVAFGSL
jgi:Na+/H+-dicarboxylate symporter